MAQPKIQNLAQKCSYEVNGRTYRINPVAVERAGLSEERLSDIINIHIAIGKLIKKVEESGGPKSTSEAKSLVNRVERYEYDLQAKWGFTLNKNYHVYWHALPGCLCPKTDNFGNKGSLRTINLNCPYHGG